MSKNYRNFIITFLISVGLGCAATYLIASSQNGYVAGFIVLPLILLIGTVSLILLIAGFICLGLEKKLAPWLLLAAVLLPFGFTSSAILAKHFELGAYHQEPMVSFSDEANNIVIFKEGITEKQINDFWEKVLSEEREDGRGYNHLPGVRTMMRSQPRNGNEVIAFGFFANASEEQKQSVFAKVKSSPIVYQLLENQSLKEFNANSEKPSSSSNSNAPLREAKIINSITSK